MFFNDPDELARKRSEWFQQLKKRCPSASRKLKALHARIRYDRVMASRYLRGSWVLPGGFEWENIAKFGWVDEVRLRPSIEGDLASPLAVEAPSTLPIGVVLWGRLPLRGRGHEPPLSNYPSHELPLFISGSNGIFVPFQHELSVKSEEIIRYEDGQLKFAPRAGAWLEPPSKSTLRRLYLLGGHEEIPQEVRDRFKE